MVQDFDPQNILEKKASATEKHQSSYLKEHLKTKATATTLAEPHWKPHLRFDANSGSPGELAWLTENPACAVVSGLMFLELDPDTDASGVKCA